MIITFNCIKNNPIFYQICNAKTLLKILINFEHYTKLYSKFHKKNNFFNGIKINWFKFYK